MHFDLVAKWLSGARAMIGRAKTEKVESTKGEQAQVAVEASQLAEIEKNVKAAVAQGMFARLPADMSYGAGIDRRNRQAAAGNGLDGMTAIRPNSSATRQGRRTPPSCSATARPACNPSSWKPAPKYAPQNQVWRPPWSDQSWRCAASVAASNTGWS